jgi:hypothetical protein
MNSVFRRAWRIGAAGVLVGLLAKIGTVTTSYYSASLGLPSAGFFRLLNEAFSGKTSTVSDREAAAIMNASIWFTDAVVPGVVAIAIGFVIGLFWRLPVGVALVAAATFAIFQLSFTCCWPSEVIGVCLFLVALLGAERLGSAAVGAFKRKTQP